MATARRTSNLILGVGDGKLGTMRAFQYGHSVFNVIDDVNIKPYNETWHYPIKNVVYYGMDWLCPPYTLRLAQMAEKFWGNITAENLIHQIVPMTTTGNLQVAVYDLTNNVTYISYARKDGVTIGAFDAYNRPYIRLNTAALWTELAPTKQEIADSLTK